MRACTPARLEFFTPAGGAAHTAVAVMLVVSAALSPLLARLSGTKLTVAGALAAIAAGLWQVSVVSNACTTYGQVVPGLLLIGPGGPRPPSAARPALEVLGVHPGHARAELVERNSLARVLHHDVQRSPVRVPSAHNLEHLCPFEAVAVPKSMLCS